MAAHALRKKTNQHLEGTAPMRSPLSCSKLVRPAIGYTGDDMKTAIPLLAVLSAGALLLLHPEAASGAVRDGLALCAGTVIPSLFPFFVVVSLLLQLGLADCLQGFCAPFMGPLFRLRGICALPLLTGLLGGYPTGAKTAADLFRQGRLTRREAELLLGFCDNCGPAFLLGCVGSGVFGSSRAGIWLYLIHVFSALVTGMVLCRVRRDRGPALLESSLPAKPVSFPRALTSSAAGAVTSTLNICAFVVLFRVLAALAPAQLPPAALGVLEMVTGVTGLTPTRSGFAAAAGIVGWGGLSVHCQALSACEDLSFRWHWVGKALQGVLSAALATAVYGLCPLS